LVQQIVTVAGAAMASVPEPLRININAALLTILVGIICFFYSCLFNNSKLALSCSTGVNIGFLLLFIFLRLAAKSTAG